MDCQARVKRRRCFRIFLSPNVTIMTPDQTTASLMRSRRYDVRRNTVARRVQGGRRPRLVMAPR